MRDSGKKLTHKNSGETGGKKNKSGRRLLPVTVAVIALAVGLAVLLYPSVSEYVSSLNYRRTIEDYGRSVGKMDDAARLNDMDAARAWNDELSRVSGRIGSLSDEQKERYLKLLDPTGTGMMGYVEIGKLNIYLPIYHGTEEETLHGGIGHVEGSSLPIGGEGTHAILSGHTGLPSAKLFSNIDQLEKGDVFLIHVLGETLAYKVDSLKVMLPEQAEKQEIKAGEDICTLMTCTPYGVNTHRLLVRGIRTELPAKDSGGDKEAKIPVRVPVLLKVAIAVLATAVVVTVTVLIVRACRTRKRDRDG